MREKYYQLSNNSTWWPNPYLWWFWAQMVKRRSFSSAEWYFFWWCSTQDSKSWRSSKRTRWTPWLWLEETWLWWSWWKPSCKFGASCCRLCWSHNSEIFSIGTRIICSGSSSMVLVTEPIDRCVSFTYGVRVLSSTVLLEEWPTEWSKTAVAANNNTKPRCH